MLPSSADAETAEAIVDESEALINGGKLTQAERVLKRAIKLNSKLAEAHYNLGLVYAEIGNTKAAIAELKTAAELKPLISQVWLMLASVQQSSGDLDAAIASYDQFMSRFPNHKLYRKINSLRNGLNNEREKLAEKEAFPDQVRWKRRQMPLTVYVAPASGVEGDFIGKSTYTRILRDAFKNWQRASAAAVKFRFVHAPDDADIECRWVQDPDQFENKAEAGQCEFHIDEEDRLRCLIKFQTNPINQTIQSQNINRLRRASLHEIGHALGLLGHSKDPKDIMFYSIVISSNAKPSNADVRRLKNLYSP